MDITSVLFYQPIFNLLVVFYRFFSENLGLAIILLALLSRVITLPITLRQIRMMGSNKEMQEKLTEVKNKYKNDKEKQQQEMAKVQAEYLPAQLAGCLPIILQFILFINVYNVIHNLIQGVLVEGARITGEQSFNLIAYPFVEKFAEGYQINSSFFGIVDLKAIPSAIGFGSISILPYLIIILLAALTQYYSAKLSMNQVSANNASKELDKDKKKKSDKADPSEDFSAALQQSTKQTMILFPLMIGVFAYSAPIGLAIYWITQNTFVIIQTLLIKRIKRQAVPVMI